MRKSITRKSKLAGLMGALLAMIFSVNLGHAANAPDPMQDGARHFQRADYKGAVASWQPMAVKGHPVAQNNLGILYLDGKGVKQDTSEAVRYLSLSAAAGSSLGQNNLGGLYRERQRRAARLCQGGAMVHGLRCPRQCRRHVQSGADV